MCSATATFGSAAGSKSPGTGSPSIHLPGVRLARIRQRNDVLERLSGERPREVIEVEVGEAIESRAAAEPRDMRRDDHTLVAPERMGCRQRLVLENIGGVAGQMAAVERGEEAAVSTRPPRATLTRRAPRGSRAKR